MESGTGKKLVDIYEKTQKLSPSEREILVSSIVRNHLEKDVPMTAKIFEDISDKIVRKFNNEVKV